AQRKPAARLFCRTFSSRWKPTWPRSTTRPARLAGEGPLPPPRVPQHAGGASPDTRDTDSPCDMLRRYLFGDGEHRQASVLRLRDLRNEVVVLIVRNPGGNQLPRVKM